MAPARLVAEVCVVGGGPAGAALACRLATLGHDVVVVEREPFPRPHVGESIGPLVWPLLEMLGARAAIEAAGFPRAVEARVRWGGPEQRRPAGGVPGITVDRGVFDRVLLDRARVAGATILQPATARRPAAVAGGWEVPVASAGEGPRIVRARVVADASGRRRVLGGRRTRTSPRTLALHASWHGVEPDGAQTRVEARPEYWLWGAHLPGGGFRAMAFVEPGLVRQRRRAGDGLEELYCELLAGAALFRHLVAGEARLEGAVCACDATCYADEDPVDALRVKVGEAAFAIDPLSSSGVQTAIQTGVAEDGEVDAAVTYVREHQRHAVERHARLAARSYGDCAAYAAEPFWRLRGAQAPEPPAAGAPVALRDLLEVPVRLSRGAALVPTPCVVGDGVRVRRALSHPALARPVAYLGGSELAPLLDRLSAERPLRDVLEEWSGSLPPGTAYSIADWLARRALLDPVCG